ncbi:peptide deformylase [Aestuariibaculum sp. TT11]|uniref:Peptide deformylase n=2 Tax=Aestuariibaculum sediminum TaxID=2770637 RepID=A0A8J6Q9X1_9FLAO|nr:peptide deformylase [Aestuariibaculum sediminum]
MKRIGFILLLVITVQSCSSFKSIFHSRFLKDQEQLILASPDTAPMRVFKITNSKDSLLLRTKSKNIKASPNDPTLQHFIKRLYATVTDSMSLGVGIAAPQVGILKNIIWVQRFDKENFPFEVYLNPKIKIYSIKKQVCREGCLSIPNRSDTLKTRAFSIKISYDTLEGKHLTETVEGFTSVIFQHEIDHLNGILYLDHLSEEVEDAT